MPAAGSFAETGFSLCGNGFRVVYLGASVAEAKQIYSNLSQA